MLNLIVVTGYAGSGKTELSKILATETSYGLIDKDTVSRPFVEAMLKHLDSYAGDRESLIYQEHIRDLEYQVLNDIIEENLTAGVPLIVTAPWIASFGDENFWEQKRTLIDALYGATLHLVWVRSDEKTMRSRISSRNALRDTHKLAHWNEYAASLDIDLGADAADYIIENAAGAQPISEQALALLKEIGIECSHN